MASFETQATSVMSVLAETAGKIPREVFETGQVPMDDEASKRARTEADRAAAEAVAAVSNQAAAEANAHNAAAAVAAVADAVMAGGVTGADGMVVDLPQTVAAGGDAVAGAPGLGAPQVGVNTTSISTTGSGKKGRTMNNPWTAQEDAALQQHVAAHGATKWANLAATLQNRTGKQCRERWHTQINSNISKAPWSEEEDRILISAHSQHGSKWATIAKLLPGRTDNGIKNRWMLLLRRGTVEGGAPKAAVQNEQVKTLEASLAAALERAANAEARATMAEAEVARLKQENQMLQGHVVPQQ